MEARENQFPLSLSALGFIVFAFYTLARTTLAIDVNPNIAAKANILFEFLIGGLFLAVLTALVLDRSLKNVVPHGIGSGFTSQQGIITFIGFLALGFFQLIVNQYSLSPLLLNATHQTQIVFGIDAGIAEEAVFSAFLTMLIFRVLARITARSLSLIAIGLITAVLVALAFVDFHGFVYGTNPSARLFVFGARLILVAIYLVTKSLVAVTIIHVSWNYLTFATPQCPIPLLGGC